MLATSWSAVGAGSRRPQTRGYQIRLRERATNELTSATTRPGSASGPAACCAAAPIRVKVSGWCWGVSTATLVPGAAAIRTWACSLAMAAAYQGASRMMWPA